MNITFSKKKQEMRHDPIMESMVSVKDWLAKNSTLVSSIALGVLFVAVLTMVFIKVREGSMQKAQESFGKAMVAYINRDEPRAIELLTAVTDNNKHTAQATYAAYLLGTLYLNKDQYDEAIEWLSSISSRRNAAFVPGAAIEALAVAYEGKGDLQKAAQYYMQAINDQRIAYRKSAIIWKLALVRQQLNEPEKASALCQEILADTASADLYPKAEQLLAEIKYGGKS